MPLILPYDPAWPLQFQQIRDLLETALGEHHLRVEHVGSTAVPGLAAKPIIDIDIVYKVGQPLSPIIAALKSLGYFHNGDQGIPGRDVFKRPSPSSDQPVLDAISHHLYACPEDSVELQRHLLFRDYLREHEEARNRYAILKTGIARVSKQDRKRYAQLKEMMAKKFVAEMLAAAGWVEG